MLPVRGIERTVTKAVISPRERDYAAFAGGEHRRFERGFDGFKTGIGENHLAGFFTPAPALNSRVPQPSTFPTPESG